MSDDVVTMDQRITECRDRGATLLDEKVPGWVDRVDVDKLDICSGFWCLLTQLLGDYSDGLVALGISTGTQHGFDCAYVDCAQLTLSWRELITARRAAQREGDQVAK